MSPGEERAECKEEKSRKLIRIEILSLNRENVGCPANTFLSW